MSPDAEATFHRATVRAWSPGDSCLRTAPCFVGAPSGLCLDPRGRSNGRLAEASALQAAPSSAV